MIADAPDIKEQNIQELIHDVRDRIGDPVNVWAVASTIESMGIRDVDVRDDYGRDGIFDVAEVVYQELKRIEQQRIDYEEEGEESEFSRKIHRFFNGIYRFFRYYKYGMMYVLPILAQVVALFVFKYSLWAYLYFNVTQATIIAIGTMLGFIVTGGFVQVLGRVSSYYAGMENYKLSQRITRNFVFGGVITLFAIAFLLFITNLFIPFYPQWMFILSMIYGILIGILILAGAALYALRETIVIAGAIIIGTVLVIVNVDYFNLNIYLSQWMGLLLSIILMLGYSAIYFRRKVHLFHEEDQSSELPKFEVMYYENYRYFLYGFLYFFFLFLDRIVAWSVGNPVPPYIIWFKTPYELGMDWALLSLILTAGVLEYSVNTFSELLMPLQSKIHLDSVSDFNDYFFKFYIRQLLLVIVLGIVSIIASYYMVLYFKPLGNRYTVIRDFFSSYITYKVFWIASVGYLFLSIGLLHTLFLFTLARPKNVIYSIFIAIIVNFVVGFVLSRLFHYEDAVYGMTVGAFVFAVVTGFIAFKFFKRMDYYYYSAY